MRAEFPPERIRAIRQNPEQLWCTVVTPGTSLPPAAKLRNGGAIVPLYRVVTLEDSEGNVLEVRRERVNDVRQGELYPACITVLRIDRNVAIVDFTRDIALACGFRTTEELRTAWLAKHPRSPLCHLVHFSVGDVRDRPNYLQWTGRGDDYTSIRARALDHLESLNREQVEALVNDNRQKDVAVAAKTSTRLRENESLAQRVARLQRARDRFGDEVYRALRPNLRVIDQRLKRAEKRQEDDG